MNTQRIFIFLKEWLKITQLTFLILSLITVLMLVLFTIIKVPSFVIGNDVFWILRRQDEV